MRAVIQWFRQLDAWVRRLFLLSSLVAILGAILVYTPTAYYITAPGAAIDTSRLIAVEGGDRHRGRLYMLVVNTQPANLFWYLYAKLDDRAVLESREAYLGPFQSYTEYLDWSKQLMTDSQRTARAIALQQLGFGEGVKPAGALVRAILAESPASGILKAGDVILALDGQPVVERDDLAPLLQQHKPGEEVTVRLRRGDQELELRFPTMEAKEPERKGVAIIGITVENALQFDDQAVPVEIKSGAIFGPSAGLMFTLQIIDQLTPGGLLQDLVVAGTGTIEPDGRVGLIGGVQQKVYTAEAAGANVMFVPQGNYEAAAQVATRIQVVPVGTVRDALDWIRGHQTEGNGAGAVGAKDSPQQSASLVDKERHGFI